MNQARNHLVLPDTYRLSSQDNSASERSVLGGPGMPLKLPNQLRSKPVARVMVFDELHTDVQRLFRFLHFIWPEVLTSLIPKSWLIHLP